ncbi:unnamed protein product, partial [Brassica oleracea var. botrytis]
LTCLPFPASTSSGSDESSTEIVADTATTGEEINRSDERLTVEKKMISQTEPMSLFEFKRVHLYGVTSICGRLPEMEDVVSTIPSFLQSPTNSLIDGRFSSQSTAHVFGVCNGHGGSQLTIAEKEKARNKYIYRRC